MSPAIHTAQLVSAMARAMELRGQAVLPQRLAAAAASIGDLNDPQASLKGICRLLDLAAPAILREPDMVHAPMLAFVQGKGWGVISERTPQGHWLLIQDEGLHALSEPGDGDLYAWLSDEAASPVMACSILVGRVLTPVLSLPGLIVQQAHAKAALKGLDHLYSLETDHHGVARPLSPRHLRGRFELTGVAFSHPDQCPGIAVSELRIHPGERIGILGPVGAGKSTLLRVLAGLYRPQKGRALIDGLDMAQINRQVLSQRIGYLQQDHRLFQGTLRENLLIGLPDPGDDAIHEALIRSGLIHLVSNHPRGLELPIREGGTGLSGGQRQLVAFTRLLLSRPAILLLDEPTASMDDVQERRCLDVLVQEMAADRTLVVVTHKRAVLSLVSRLIVVTDNAVAMDGPRDEVLKRLARRASEGALSEASKEPLRPPTYPVEG